MIDVPTELDFLVSQTQQPTYAISRQYLRSNKGNGLRRDNGCEMDAKNFSSVSSDCSTASWVEKTYAVKATKDIISSCHRFLPADQL